MTTETGPCPGILADVGCVHAPNTDRAVYCWSGVLNLACVSACHPDFSRYVCRYSVSFLYHRTL